MTMRQSIWIELLMTHPHVNSRIKASMEYKVPDGFKAREFGLNWNKVKESIQSTEGNTL